ncbi:hypothetical protein [Chloroflexus sp.]|uniref:hypothetical protein n=1 Tax=Chloroflexus sp. TaxID=1904827 RepID=UPI0026224545|nr:hypothetical protein [uncultured Chloroflexus sp.]
MIGLPIRRMVLYKHGVAYFERRGSYSGDSLTLSFPRQAMDDVLKSLVVIDQQGQVRNIDFATPENRDALLNRSSIHLSNERSLLDLLRDLRGRQVRLTLVGKQGETISGLVIGVDIEEEQPLRRAIVSLYLNEERSVRPVALDELARVELLDEVAQNDLAFFLRVSQSDERNRTATIHLTPGDHDLIIGYVAPAPAWRVSYRLLVTDTDDGAVQCFMQGWGLFDNQLEEDLVDVEVTLVAGLPVSFRYRLYEPQIPERPQIGDFPRSAARADALERSRIKRSLLVDIYDEAAPAFSREISPEPAMNSAPPIAVGEERGALFAYRVMQPVSVGRGQSAMAPIVGATIPGRRELVYNEARRPRYPLAALRLSNETGLTLEQGPATVLINGEYAGESVLPFTRAGAEIDVFYAVELGVTVNKYLREERRLHGVGLSEGDLIIDEYSLKFYRYTITSTLAEPCVVVIEHHRDSDAELADTPPPVSTTDELARWRVPVAAFGQAELTICERTKLSRRETITSLTGELLQELLQENVIDRATLQRLKGVFDLLRQIDAANQAIANHERERQLIFERQQRLQQQIAPLRSDGEEGALRQRYVTTLAQLEDQLEQIDAAIAEQRALIEKLQTQIKRRLSRL